VIEAIVTSYINPDLDGVASAMVWADYLERFKETHATPVVFGRLDDETMLVLGVLELGHPEIVPVCPDVEAIYLVDTHDPVQLDNTIPREHVVAIIDHHSSGNPNAFPNANVENYPIGAVATVLAERIKGEQLQFDQKFLALLAAAIISNTMALSAPSTTERDSKMLTWLSTVAPLPVGLKEQMLQTRSRLAGKPTQTLLLENYKEYRIESVPIGIVQLEGTDVMSFLLRPDLYGEITELRRLRSISHIVVSVVDALDHKTYVTTDEVVTRTLLEDALSLQFTGKIAVVDKILLRKTDLVPGLRRQLSGGE